MQLLKVSRQKVIENFYQDRRERGRERERQRGREEDKDKSWPRERKRRQRDIKSEWVMDGKRYR
jgi:hypothetical protein